MKSPAVATAPSHRIDATQRVAVFGATGSIGKAALEVIEFLGQPWQLWAISGHSQHALLEELAEKYQPKHVVYSGSEGFSVGAAGSSLARFKDLKRHYGSDALTRLAESPEISVLIAAIVGRAGLESTLAALKAGKRVALANKETLVMAGHLVQQLLRQSDATLLPVDSEHSAIAQCLAAGPKKFARRLILTASGGPLRHWTRQEMERATIADALNHPTWKMGKKITIDSATMMNKALEIVEARWLFDVSADQIEVLIHPQSVIHSLVEFTDGSVVAQMGPPDMRLPIQYALTYPERLAGPATRWERSAVWNLQLEPVDRERFPAIEIGFEVAKVGGSSGTVVNAANEQAVELFLQGRIRFTDIVAACRAVLDHHHYDPHPSLEELLALDQWARAEVTKWICSARN